MRDLRKLNESSFEGESDGSWAISYGDMITLLLSFFVIYFSTDPQQDKDQTLNSSLLAALEPMLVQESRSPASSARGKVQEDLYNLPMAKVFEHENAIIVEFDGVSFFSSGQIEVSRQGRVALKQFAEAFVPFAGHYVLGIKAYTDNRPVRNSRGRRFKDNLELSALRAIASMRILQIAGIPLKNMHITGEGELLPHDKKDLSLSRKVVLIIQRNWRQKGKAS